MPTNTFSLGKDTQLVLIGPSGQVNLSIVTGFNSKQTVKTVHVDPLNGPPLEARPPAGWTGSFTIERGDSTVDDLIATIEQGFWAGGNLGTGQIYQYVTEVSGATSTYLYDGVSMSLSDAGSWQTDSSVKQTLEFFASMRRKVS
jgi:hypothetical protein